MSKNEDWLLRLSRIGTLLPIPCALWFMVQAMIDEKLNLHWNMLVANCL